MVVNQVDEPLASGEVPSGAWPNAPLIMLQGVAAIRFARNGLRLLCRDSVRLSRATR